MAKYDAQTLKALSQNGRIELNRFSEQAIGHNIVRPNRADKGVLTEQAVNCSHNMSSHSRQSVRNSARSDSNPHNTVRQPNDPPSVQSDAGFARFLKEHTSPRTKRVTAGGRIVPMNFTDPPPKCDLLTTKQNTTYGNVTATQPGLKGKYNARAENQSVSQSHTTAGNNISFPENTHENNQGVALGGNHVNQQFSGTVNSENGQPAASTHPSNEGDGLEGGRMNQDFSGPAYFQMPQLTVGGTGTFSQSEGSLTSANQQYVSLVNPPQPQGYPMPHQGHLIPHHSYIPSLQEYQVSPQEFPVPPQEFLVPYQGYPIPIQPMGISGPDSVMYGSNDFHGANSANLQNRSLDRRLAVSQQYQVAPRAAPMTFDQFQQGYDLSEYNTGAQWPRVVNSQMQPWMHPIAQPVAQSFIPQHIEEAHYQKALDDAKRQFDALNNRLSRVDRHIAMHHWDMDPSTKQTLVEERMSLVRQLDTTRVYREHLQFLFGKTRLCVPERPMMPLQPQMDVSASTMHEPSLMGPPLLTMNPNFTPSQQVFSTREHPHSAGAWQMMGDQNTYHYGTQAANAFIPQDMAIVQSEPESQMAVTSHSLSEANTQRERLESTSAKETRLSPSRSTTSTISTPIEISKIYRAIKQATRQRKPIDGLLKELSMATAQLVKQDTLDKSTEIRRSPSVQEIRQLPPKSPRVKAESLDEEEQPDKFLRHPVRRSRRLWESENMPQRTKYPRITGPPQTTDDDDGRSSVSLLSTTDSWITTQGGEKRWMERDIQNCEQPQDKSEESRMKERQKNPRLPTEAQTPSPQATTAYPSTPLGPRPLVPNYPTSFEREPFGSPNKTPYRPLVTQCFNKDRSPALQKTMAVAVPHNVNVQAWFRPFGGEGDGSKTNDILEPSGSKSDDTSQATEKRGRVLRKSARLSIAGGREK